MAIHDLSTPPRGPSLPVESPATLWTADPGRRPETLLETLDSTNGDKKHFPQADVPSTNSADEERLDFAPSTKGAHPSPRGPAQGESDVSLCFAPPFAQYLAGSAKRSKRIANLLNTTCNHRYFKRCSGDDDQQKALDNLVDSITALKYPVDNNEVETVKEVDVDEVNGDEPRAKRSRNA